MLKIKQISAAVVLAFLLASSILHADTKIVVYKSFKGGTASKASPNQTIAGWGMTVDGVTTKRELVYLGRTGENVIEVESRESEKPVKGGSEKLLSTTKIPIYLDCDGETICRVEEISLALRASDNTLHYTILADWDEVYINQRDRVKQCEFGHKWVEKEFFYCPVCGGKLKSASLNATGVTASSDDK
jgi:hypothetical protein